MEEYIDLDLCGREIEVTVHSNDVIDEIASNMSEEFDFNDDDLDNFYTKAKGKVLIKEVE